MPTFKLVLRKNKRREDGTTPVFLRITEGRKSRYRATGIYVPEKDWNEKREEVRRGHPQSVIYNDRLTQVKHEAEAKAFGLLRGRMGRVSAEAIKREIQGKGASNFFPYARAYAEEHRARGKYWEWKKTLVVIEKLRALKPAEQLSFTEIDHDFLVGFDRYMREELKNQANTRVKNFQILHRIIKRAILEGYLDRGQDPFYCFKTEAAPTKKEKLSLDEIEALEGLALPPGSSLDISRDAFLFSFYCAGVRFGDLCRLQWQNVASGRLRYTMAKTGATKDLEIPPEGEAILAKYRSEDSKRDDLVFPILESGRDYSDPNFIRQRIATKNTLVNKDLKELAEMIETKKNVSFHISRHSYADFARRVGIDLYTVSKSLGHSNLKITETYLSSFDQEAVDTQMRKAWEKKRGRKATSHN